jgi:hypothetical protein
MEALLSAYYGLRKVELNYDRLSELRGDELPNNGIRVPPRSKSKGIPLRKETHKNKEADATKKKNKRSA